MDNWHNQFLKSLQKYENRNREYQQELLDDLNIPHYNFTGSTDLHIRKNAQLTDKNKLTEQFLYALTNQFIDHAFIQLRQLLDKTESPIEKQMGVALWVAGNELFSNVELEFSNQSERIPTVDSLIIKPQGMVDKYRADFVLKTKAILPKFEDGNIIRDVEVEKFLIVECDGHDYHEKTKEQARKDKSRDRIIQSEDYEIFRYTGSEIWEDVFSCAIQAVKRINESAYRRANELSEA